MAVTPEPDAALTVLDDPRVEAFGMFVETHNELNTALTKRLNATDAPPIPWLGVLIRLARTPGQRLRMSELARDMTMSTSGLTRLVDRIESAGHVVREACPDDRRGLWAVLTPDGLDVVVTAAPGHLADLDELLSGALTNPQIVELTDLLRRVRDHVRGMQDSPR